MEPVYEKVWGATCRESEDVPKLRAISYRLMADSLRGVGIRVSERGLSDSLHGL